MQRINLKLRRPILAMTVVAVSVSAASPAFSLGSDAALCPPDMQKYVDDTRRQAIEYEVGNFEKAYPRPTPLDEVSCLTDLMDLDFSYSLGFPNINNLLSKIRDRICHAGQEIWNQATEQLKQRITLPSIQLPENLGTIGGGSIGTRAYRDEKEGLTITPPRSMRGGGSSTSQGIDYGKF